MTSDAPRVLAVTAEQVMTRMLPEMGAAYSQGSAAVTALLLRFVAQEFDRAADMRARENAEMRTLFAELAPAVQDMALRGEMKAASATRDGSLLVSELDASNVALKRLLIAAQAHLEDIGAREAALRIWSALKTMAARRVVSL
jgi:hypothetical protein